MTDKELIAEFSRLVRSTLELRGVVRHSNQQVKDTWVDLGDIRLHRADYTSGEMSWSVYNPINLVFYETKTDGIPGAYGPAGAGRDAHCIPLMRKLLPDLRQLTVLDLLAGA